MGRNDIDCLSNAQGLNAYIDNHPMGCKLAAKVLNKERVNCTTECPFSKCVADYSERTEKRILDRLLSGQVFLVVL